MDKDAIIVLYGKQKSGKTSTLKELVVLLTGNPNVPLHDIRIIIQYKGKNIFISTYGDDAKALSRNFDFFVGITPAGQKKKNLIFINGKYEKVKNAAQMKTFVADICISACRSTPKLINTMNQYLYANLKKTFWTSWIRQEQLKKKINSTNNNQNNSNFQQMASEIRNFIDKHLI